MENIISNEELVAIASKNTAIMQKYEKDEGWVPNGQVKTDKLCKMYKMNIQTRVASKGVVEDVQGTLEELVKFVYDQQYIFKLDPDLKEYKELRHASDEVHLCYMRYNGMGPVADRDFLLIQKIQWSNDKNRFSVASKSITLPYDLPKGVVRGNCLIGGYIVEKVGENKCRVTYLSDGDINGSIPDFVKRIFSQNQGSIAGRVNACLKQWRQKKGKK